MQGEADRAKLILNREAGESRMSWCVQRPSRPTKSCEPDSTGTMLAFLIHNLDTGITGVIEEAWDEYVRDSHQATCATKPITARAANGSRIGAGLKASTQTCSKSFRDR